jgi:hypothetical protein
MERSFPPDVFQVVKVPQRPREGIQGRLCEETHLNLAYRWFCRLGLATPWRGTQDFRENYLTLPDQGVTLPVRYA